jgi:4-hydroxybenzoyl-CoA thioesterase
VSFSNRIPLRIEWGHCDPAGIVYNPRFFEWFDIGAWTLVQAALGVPRNELSSRFGIIGLPLVEAGANFKSALKFGDDAELVSTVIDLGRSSISVQHHIYKGDAVAVDGLEKRVWAGPHPDDPSRMRAIPIPDEVRAKLKR